MLEHPTAPETLGELREQYRVSRNEAAGYIDCQDGSYEYAVHRLREWLRQFACMCAGGRNGWTCESTPGLFRGQWVCPVCRNPSLPTLERLVTL